MTIKSSAKSLFQRCWPLAAGVAIFAVAQLAAHVIPHSCTF